jgi:hypothetical protein
VFLALLAPAFLARANDSASMLAAGGIVLVKTDKIVMQREDLTLSPSEIRVRYEMRNDTAAPVTLRVAFPLPEIPKETPDGLETTTGASNIDMAVPTEPNFLGFRVSANGVAIKPDLEIHATLAGGRDITAQLQAIGGWPLLLHPRIYEKPFEPAADPKDPPRQTDTWDIDAATRQKLRDLGALTEDSDGYDMLWTTHVTFHWMQVFPPGVTVIEHVYRPILGVQLTAPLSRSGGSGKIDVEHGRWGGSGDATDAEKTFCIDSATSAAIRAAYKSALSARAASRAAQHLPPEDDPYITTYSLGYILKTARNWKGPIGTFHLTLEGGRVDVPSADGGAVAVMSLCTDLPLRETGPMRFEATARNYVPKDDLRVLLVTK